MEETKLDPDNVVQVVEVGSKNEEPLIVRLTPTGKISHAKTRVYTQRYRKEWEHMTDFKDWLTSVPNQATRAYCNFCERNLHAHRLSLLKHMCTLKHQRAAAQYSKRQANQSDETSSDVNYVIEKLENDDENDTSYDTSYVQDDEEEECQDEVEEEIIEESEYEADEPSYKKTCFEKNQSQDTLAQAIAQSDFLTENDEPIHLEMVVESDHDNDDEEGQSYNIVKCAAVSNSKDQSKVQKELKKNSKITCDDKTQETGSHHDEEAKSDSKKTDATNKMYFFSSSGKSYTLVKGKLPSLVVNNKNLIIDGKGIKTELKSISNSIEVPTPPAAGSNTESKNKNVILMNTATAVKSVLLHKPVVTTHVMETSKGTPVSGLQVSLYKLQDGRWTFLHESITSVNGNINAFINSAKLNLSTGRYKLHYDVERYYHMRKIETIYPFIEIVFDIKDPNATHHVPLLLSPFSYSTYKDSNR